MPKMKIALLLYAKDLFSPLDECFPQEESLCLAQNLLALLEKSTFRYSLFLPGPVIESLVRFAPQEMASLRSLIRDRRVEILGGGFYDPMLPLFPTTLQNLQLSKLNSLITKQFKVEPNGYFNSSIVWEIGMTETLAKHRFEYTLVPDSSLQLALGRTTAVTGWFTVENQGSLLRLLPVSAAFTEAFQKSSDDFKAEMDKFPGNDRFSIAALNIPLDDVETIERFFNHFQTILDVIENPLWTLSHIFELQRSEGRVNLVSAVGEGLGLPNGSHSCRELLLRRPEIDFLHKSLLAQYRQASEDLRRKDLETVDEMLLPVMAPFFYRDLHDNEGIRSPGVRWKGYQKIVRAMVKSDQLRNTEGLRVDVFDYLLGGEKQIWVDNEKMSFLVEHFKGTVLRSLIFKPSNMNLLCAMRDDGEPSVAFLDHLIPETFTTVAALDNAIQDRQNTLVAPYDYQIQREKKRLDLLFHSEQILQLSDKQQLFQVDKTFTVASREAAFDIKYRLTNSMYADFCGMFGTELELGSRAFDAKNQFLKINDETIPFDFTKSILYPDALSVAIQDKLMHYAIRLELKRPTRILLSPILGTHQHASPESVQGVRLFFFWDLKLSSLKSTEYEISVRMAKRRFL